MYVNDSMYVGFSRSTQGRTKVHNVKWWDFNSFLDSSVTPTTTSPPSTTLAPRQKESKSFRKGIVGVVARVVTICTFVIALYWCMIWMHLMKVK